MFEIRISTLQDADRVITEERLFLLLASATSSLFHKDEG